MARTTRGVRHLILVLGDQLDAASAAFDGFDARLDAVWMAEVAAEAEHVWSHKARIALFLSAMRHFRDALLARGIRVFYRALDDPANRGRLGEELIAAAAGLGPSSLVVVEPGEWRVREELVAAAARAGVEIDIRPDRSFICPAGRFAEHAAARKQLRQEFFYRMMRRDTGVLMEENGRPAGGRWNYDVENRRAFGQAGPGRVPPRRGFAPDAVTREVLALVERRFPRHPGTLTAFDWPVTPRQADQALEDFISRRLRRFGTWQDAMWTGRPWLYHSTCSAAMNLKLLDPRKAVAAAEEAWRQGEADLAAAEGFIRQVLGWREYVRGVYWRFMPQYLDRNALNADRPLPEWYWTGHTEMNCLREVIGQTLACGYAHHIQRLMVTGLYALLLGVQPRRVHEWYLAVYVDAVEWVELPNTLGMSQFADGGVMASKPYAAGGQYIRRMSNYCDGCRYRPDRRTGDDACPFTTLYWAFLMRHQRLLARNPRMVMQLRNLARLDRATRTAIRRQAERLREHG